MSKLLVFLPNGMSRAIRLDGTRLRIGRAPRNTLALPDPSVSAVHALLQHTDTGWWIEDLGSTNGTWINRKRVQASLLLPEDVLRIGACTLRLLDTGDMGKSTKNKEDQMDESLALPTDFGTTNIMSETRKKGE